MRTLLRPIAHTSLALLIAASACAATVAAADEQLTQPTDRDSRIAVGLNRLAMSKMRPSEGKSPKTVQKLNNLSGYGTGDNPAPGGQVPGAFDADSFSRFLNIGLQQSYNKTYEEGWKILHTAVQRALSDLGPLPLGVRLALQSGRDASYDRSWEDAYKILHEASKTVAGSTNEFAAVQPSTFAAYMHLARQSSYDRSYEVGWKVLEKYLDNLEKLGRELIPSQAIGVLAHAGRQASYSKSWKTAYEVEHVTVKHAEALPTGDLKGYYYITALECSYEKTYQEGYEILRTFIEQGLSSSLLNNFDQASLKTTLQASYNQPWQAAYEVLRDGLKALNQ